MFSTRQATRMVLIVCVTFALSWLPLYCIFIVAKFFDAALRSDAVRSVFYVLLPIAQWLGAANSSINPLLYAYLNRRFRAHARDAVRQLCSGGGRRQCGEPTGGESAAAAVRQRRRWLQRKWAIKLDLDERRRRCAQTNSTRSTELMPVEIGGGQRRTDEKVADVV